MSYLERAIKDGYAYISGVEGKRQITYSTSDNHTERYDEPEEKVRAEIWAELIYHYEYPVNRLKIEVTIPDRLPTDRADIVVFRDDDCKRPYAVVECNFDQFVNVFQLHTGYAHHTECDFRGVCDFVFDVQIFHVFSPFLCFIIIFIHKFI